MCEIPAVLQPGTDLPVDCDPPGFGIVRTGLSLWFVSSRGGNWFNLWEVFKASCIHPSYWVWITHKLMNSRVENNCRLIFRGLLSTFLKAIRLFVYSTDSWAWICSAQCLTVLRPWQKSTKTEEVCSLISVWDGREDGVEDIMKELANNVVFIAQMMNQLVKSRFSFNLTAKIMSSVECIQRV